LTSKFRTQNGLHATVIRLDDQNARFAADALQKRFRGWPQTTRLYHLVTVRVEGEAIHFIIPRQDRKMPVKALTAMFALNLRYALDAAPYLVYKGRCYLWEESSAAIIRNATIKRRKPSVQN
jgi:hypothetical protein